MANNLNDYLALVKKRRAAQTITLLMPSGAEWILTPVNTQQLMVSGKLPTALYVKVRQGGTPPTEGELLETTIKTMELARDVMLNNLVFPRITEKPSKDSICIDDVGEMVDPEDFNYFLEWLLAGGQAGQNTKSAPTG